MKTHVGVLKGHDGWTCPSCGSSHVIRDGKRIGATGVSRQRMQCQDCGHKYLISQANTAKYVEHILDKKEKENQIKRKTKNNGKRNNKKKETNSR